MADEPTNEVTRTPEPEPVNEQANDHDSVFSGSDGSSTESLSSSIIDYRRENGRTYHRYKDGKYNVPNDEQENERLDLQHHLFLLTFDHKLGLAPPSEKDSGVKRVLDLGTGTGVWAIDFGDEHPGAHIVGVDLSPIQPSFVPPNVEFFVDDVEEDWTFSKKFDYIHSRMMTSSIASWPAYLKQMFDNLTPGGYAELQEIDIMIRCDDDTLKDDNSLLKGLNLAIEAAAKFGREFQKLDELKDAMAAAGFVDIVETKYQWPSNTWPKDKKLKEIGAWNNLNMTSGVEGFMMAPLTRAHGWEVDEVKTFLAQVRTDTNDTSVHVYWPVYSIYGRKPEEPKQDD